MNNPLTPDQCLKILKDAGCGQDVIDHSKVVSELSVKIAEKINGADIELVRTGGLLHDLGRARTHEIAHAVEGVKIARELDLPDKLIEIIQRHIGAGLLPEEAQKLGLPDWDYIPRTIEQKIVAHADNLIDFLKVVPVKNTLDKLIAKGQIEAAGRVKQLHEELSNLAGIDLDNLVNSDH